MRQTNDCYEESDFNQNDYVSTWTYNEAVKKRDGIIDNLRFWLRNACQLLEAHEVTMAKPLDEWWKKLKEEDRKRAERDAALAEEEKKKGEHNKRLKEVKERLMTELTSVEKQALGLEKVNHEKT